MRGSRGRAIRAPFSLTRPHSFFPMSPFVFSMVTIFHFLLPLCVHHLDFLFRQCFLRKPWKQCFHQSGLLSYTFTRKTLKNVPHFPRNGSFLKSPQFPAVTENSETWNSPQTLSLPHPYKSKNDSTSPLLLPRAPRVQDAQNSVFSSPPQ